MKTARRMVGRGGSKPAVRVDFCEEGQAYLIIAAPSGVTYSAQTNGVCCDHPEIEGAILAVVIHASELADLMEELGGGIVHGLGSEDVKAANAMLSKLDFAGWGARITDLVMDPKRLDESHEGWWWVTFTWNDPLDRRPSVKLEGVICGPNSD